MDLSATQILSRNAGNLAARKIWLPKLLYDCLPYFYLASGISAFFATLYISAWFWVLPHYMLFSIACLHLAFHIFRRRRRNAPGNQSSVDPGSQARYPKSPIQR
jgi:hypothetical protein